MTLNTVILAAMERGLTLHDIQHMTIAAVVDFIIDHNERQAAAERAAKKGGNKTRAATQADIDAFLA